MLQQLFKELFQGGYDQEGVPRQRWASARVLWPAGMYRHFGGDGAQRQHSLQPMFSCLLLTLVSVQLSVMVWLDNPQDSGLGEEFFVILEYL